MLGSSNGSVGEEGGDIAGGKFDGKPLANGLAQKGPGTPTVNPMIRTTRKYAGCFGFDLGNENDGGSGGSSHFSGFFVLFVLTVVLYM